MDNLTEVAINDLKLGRKGFVSSLLEAPFSEPNIGPFPQYNIIFEDEPVEELITGNRGNGRKYRSQTRERLIGLLENSTTQLIRSQSLFLNPRTESRKSLMNKVKAAGASFLQDYEQFVESNVVPYQEVFIKTESVAPTGGDAPVVPAMKPRILDVNRTAEMMELKALGAEEKLLLKQVQRIAKKLVR